MKLSCRANAATTVFLVVCLLCLSLSPSFLPCAAAIVPDAAAGPSSSVGGAGSDEDGEGAVTLGIERATPIITVDDTSRFSLTARITNATDQPVSSGRLTVYTNPDVAFTSAVDVQSWAEGTLDIWSAGTVGSDTVSALDPGESVTVTITAKANGYPFAECRSFGARPVLVSYRSDDRMVRISQHTFVTVKMAQDFTDGTDENVDESQDTDDAENGANTAGEQSSSPPSPRVRLTVAAPLTAESWDDSAEQVNYLLTGDSRYDSTDVLSPSLATGSQSALAALSSHTLSIAADPWCLDSWEGDAPSSLLLLQPAGADITSLAHILTVDRASAGISDTALYAGGAASVAKSRGYEDMRTVAWQGAGNWTEAALSYAADAGYDAVISLGVTDTSTTDDSGDAGSVQPVSADDYHAISQFTNDSQSVAVICAQSALSALFSGKKTSDTADAEATSGGRVNRMIAQTSLFATRILQGSAPSDFHVSPRDRDADYSTLFAALDASSPCSDLSAMLSAVEKADWVDLTGLDTLVDEATVGGQSGQDTAQIAQIVPASSSGVSEDSLNTLSQTLSSLTSSRDMLDRFFQAVSSPDVAQNSAANAARWRAAVYALHDAYAVRAATLAGNSRAASTAASNGTSLAAQLLGSVTISQPNSVIMMSDTATLPVTVSNRTPYPVTVTLTATPGTTGISVADSTSVTVQGNGESQAVIALNAYSSGSSYVSLQLTDSAGANLGTGIHVAVSCTLRMNGSVGYVVIAIAALLTVGGLWRQFHRKKDPDI